MNAVKEALDGVDPAGMMFSTAWGWKTDFKHNMAARTRAAPAPEVEIDAMVDNAVVERAVHTIHDAARTGVPGDGKIFVFNIENALEV